MEMNYRFAILTVSFIFRNKTAKLLTVLNSKRKYPYRVYSDIRNLFSDHMSEINLRYKLSETNVTPTETIHYSLREQGP